METNYYHSFVDTKSPSLASTDAIKLDKNGLLTPAASSLANFIFCKEICNFCFCIIQTI